MVYVGLNCKNFLVLMFKQISSWEFEKKKENKGKKMEVVFII